MALPRITHLGLKLMSVMLASLLWLLVSGEQTVERALRVPLEFTNLPTQLELVGEPPAVVDVRLRGSSGTMSRVSAGDLAAVLDVRTARAGARLFNLTAQDVRAPFGVEVVQVAPASVPLTFEASMSKSVPVASRVEGEPAPGYVISGITVEPSSVVIVGPASALANSREAITEPVSVEGKSETVTDTVTLGVAEPSVRLSQPQDAKVTVTIAAVPAEWSVGGIGVKVKNGTKPATVSPEAVAIHVRGARGPRNVDAVHFSATVDVTGLGPGRHVLPVHVEPPPGVGLLRIEPAEVTVTIR